ncbi:MAG: hydrogenase nickel incorporation protein HypA [Candidatus Bathyarchaeota archaeon]|nr:MAG: hydrogenase nickel incorporation protein HypA [Candidatus Bathyarchaeota archaeon]
MHEWALAEGIVSTAQRVAEDEGLLEITEIVINIGELQQIEHEILVFALEQLKTSTMKDVRFVLKPIQGRFRCRVCGEKWAFSPNTVDEEVSEAIHFVPEMAHVYIKCPQCDSPDFDVTEGRGVWLESVKGLKRDE